MHDASNENDSMVHQVLLPHSPPPSPYVGACCRDWRLVMRVACVYVVHCLQQRQFVLQIGSST